MPKLLMTLALVGATGEVGRAALDALDQLELPPASGCSPSGPRGTVELQGEELRVAALSDGAFRGCDVAIFCAGADVAREWAPRAWAEGCAVVDVSPAFRADADVPLVVAELNAGALASFRTRGIVATPGPSATALALALARSAPPRASSASWSRRTSPRPAPAAQASRARARGA